MFKRIISLIAVLAIMSTACCISAFAAIDYTNTYYMNSYSMYGYSAMSSSVASVSTYCANINYGKRLYHTYKYVTTAGKIVEIVTPVNSFVTNGNTTFDVSYSVPSGSTLTGVLGQHWVKASSYMIWSSHDSEDDSAVGTCQPDYSDLV